MIDELLVDLWNDHVGWSGRPRSSFQNFFLMSGEDFENLVSFFDPAVNNKNINFRNAISDGKLDRSTETSFN
jgi:hypothetical protein